MRETKKLHIGLATIMIAILLGSALLVPTVAYAAEDNYIPGNEKENHDNVTKDKVTKDKEAKEKDRKDKDDGKGNHGHQDQNCDSEKYDKKCEGNNNDNNKNCDSEKYDKECKGDDKGKGDENNLFLQNTLSSVTKFMHWNS